MLQNSDFYAIRLVLLGTLSIWGGIAGCRGSCPDGTTLRDNLCVANASGVGVAGDQATAAAPADAGAEVSAADAAAESQSSGVQGRKRNTSRDLAGEGGNASAGTGAADAGARQAAAAGDRALPKTDTAMTPGAPVSQDAGTASNMTDMSMMPDATPTAPMAGSGAPMSLDAGTSPACTPTDEKCDGQDNDCDSRIDEDVPSRPCGMNEGICKPGIIECHNGQWDDPTTQCAGSVGPRSEKCDGTDDDCDGEIDNGLERLCGSNEICMGSAGCKGCPKGNTRQGNQCQCVPMCNKQCGDDGCGHQCPSACDQAHCKSDQCRQCVSSSECSALNRGDCVVGTCASNGDCTATNRDGVRCTYAAGVSGTCSQGTCTCTPVCGNKCGGPDGCGNECRNTCDRATQDCDPSTNTCLKRPTGKQLYETCTSGNSVQGDCADGLACLLFGPSSSVQHCFWQSDCASHGQVVAISGYCAQACKNGDRSCPAAAANCYILGGPEGTDGWCTP